MERKEQSPPSGPPQAAKGEDDQSSEEKRTMVALARILGAGPLVGGSLRLLEQLANYVQCPQEGVPRETAPAKPAAAHHSQSRAEHLGTSQKYSKQCWGLLFKFFSGFFLRCRLVRKKNLSYSYVKK
jgi:hypothetical protein